MGPLKTVSGGVYCLDVHPQIVPKRLVATAEITNCLYIFIAFLVHTLHDLKIK